MSWQPDFVMKLKNVNNIFFILFGFLAVSCDINLNLEGTYSFESIYSLSGDTLVPVNQNDSLVLKSDGSFQYYLEAKNNLRASGNWAKIDSKHLKFDYAEPTDTTRYYRVKQKGKKLLLKENDVNFSFIKR